MVGICTSINDAATRLFGVASNVAFSGHVSVIHSAATS